MLLSELTSLRMALTDGMPWLRKAALLGGLRLRRREGRARILQPNAGMASERLPHPIIAAKHSTCQSVRPSIPAPSIR